MEKIGFPKFFLVFLENIKQKKKFLHTYMYNIVYDN